jgi:hypothetical protein
MGGGQLLQDQPAEQTREHTYGEEEAGSAADPALSLEQDVVDCGLVVVSNVGVISAALTASADSTNGSTSGQSSPAQRLPTRLAQDFCAVCNNISLANTLVLPVSPAPIPPTSIIRNLRWPGVKLELASSDHVHFNARGPPHA